MIQLSNSDAERVCFHLEKLYRSRKGMNSSTKEINETRMLGLLLGKINKKLDKECPNRQKQYAKQEK